MAGSSLFDQGEPFEERLRKAEERIRAAMKKEILPSEWYAVGVSVDPDVPLSFFRMGTPAGEAEEGQQAA